MQLGSFIAQICLLTSSPIMQVVFHPYDRWRMQDKAGCKEGGFPFFYFYAMGKQVLILRVLYTVIAFTQDKVFILILRVQNGL